MNNKINVERLLPYADKALNDADILVQDKVLNDTDILVQYKVPKEYLGYVAAFGATVINMGIKAALLYYMKDKRVKVVDALTCILKESRESRNGSEQETIDLKEWVKDEINILELYHKTQKIVDASVALKLMIRTYPILERQKQEKDDEQQKNAQ